MKHTTSILCLGILGTTLTFAQQPPNPPRPPRPPRALDGRRPMDLDRGGLTGPNAERRLTRVLGLNAEQQNKVHTALEEQRVQTQGLSTRSSDLRQQLAAAVRAGDESKIDQITRDLAQVNQQRSAIAAKTLAKVYGSLSADQKTRVDGALNRELNLPGGGRLRRGGPPA